MRESQEPPVRAQGPEPLPLLIAAPGVAQICGVGEATVWRMHAAGQMPAPVRVAARCTRWRRAEIEAWVAARCPGRAEWEAMQATRGTRG